VSKNGITKGKKKKNSIFRKATKILIPIDFDREKITKKGIPYGNQSERDTRKKKR